MAKATTRVHILAKELGVKSKSIVEKCQAEGLDIKNHMSTISIGLSATIREWFSEGEHKTTIEKSSRVDLEKVRTEDRRKKKAAKSEDASAEKPKEVTPAIPVLEKPVPIPIPETPHEIIDHSIPKDVKPAGPQLTAPTPAKLSGPKVIRVEEPEKLHRPRSKYRQGGRQGQQRPPQGQRSPQGQRPPQQGGQRRPQGQRPPQGGRPQQGGQRPASQNRFSKPAGENLGSAMPPQFGGAPAKAAPGKRGKKRNQGAGTEADAAKAKQNTAKQFRQRDMDDRRARLAAARGEALGRRPSRRVGGGRKGKRVAEVKHERPDKATVSEPISVKALSSAMAVKASDIIGKLMAQGVMATANQNIATDMAELIAIEFGVELTVERQESIEEGVAKEFAQRERNNLKTRPPVVTMLGHVDHGKTSLLDKIRSASVADGEAGGITQHTSAYQVSYKGNKLSFLDTPGHAAFTAMRARGANMTDIVVLVVAADDGVMPQTAEAIKHAQAAEVAIIVALNKSDLPGVDINKVYGQLAEHELVPAEWGGDTEVVRTSAITGEGIDDLVEHIEMLAELHEYKADSTIPATGWVVEAKMTSTQGIVATILLKEGCLNKGDVILAGNGFGRVRTMKNSYGKSLKKATSSMPVEITGLSDAPSAGDKFYALKDLNRAKNASEESKQLSREKSLAQRHNITLENLFSHIESGKVKELNIIIRADVQGSVDVLVKYLSDLSTDDVKIKILHSAVGGVTEGDVVLAEASGAIVIGFNVVPEDQVQSLADERGVDIRLYNIIYRITEDLRDAMTGMLDPDEVEKHLGKLTVRNTFKVSGTGTIAGCYVNSGVITKNAKLRLIRNNIVIQDNCKLESLKHFKDDVKEVKAGYECGIKLASYDDIKIDDAFEAFEIIEVAREL